jgi:hypothetical protein
MRTYLFAVIALTILASSQAVQGVAIQIDVGTPRTRSSDTMVPFSDLNGTALLDQSLSVDFRFANSEFVRLFTVTTAFSVPMILQTSSSSFVGFLSGTGYLTDSLGNALEPRQTLGRSSGDDGSMTVDLLSQVNRPIDFYGVHYDLKFPTNPAVVTGGEFRLLSDSGPFGIGPGLPTDIVPDTGSTAILLGLGFVGIILFTHCLNRITRHHY